MSATGLKKKYTQNYLRRLMEEQKNKTNKSNVAAVNQEQKINSPIAKYDEKGQLNCILCKSVVRSESIWKVHINSKKHKEKVEIAKQLKEKLQSSSVKRVNDEPNPGKIPEKKAKESSGISPKKNEIPSDFFESSVKSSKPNEKTAEEVEPSIKDSEEKGDNPLPEGFFDDPKKDAKVRNFEYKDPQEEEWLKFQKEIKEETSVSLEIIAGEVEMSTNDRQIHDIDEQIYHWQRVVNMEQKKELISKNIKEKQSKNVEENENEEDDESESEDFDEFLDWRAKNIVKKV